MSSRMPSDQALINVLKNYIMNFRVTELKTLLLFAQKNRSGKKQELQNRALGLLTKGHLSVSIENKIRELNRQQEASKPSSHNDSQASEISSSCYQAHQPKKSSSSSFNFGNHHHSTPTRSSRSSHSSNHKSSATSNDYYSSMPRAINFDYSGSSNSNSKSYISSPSFPQQASLPYPVLADVKFKSLPFYDILEDLLRPVTLMASHGTRYPENRYPENSFTFHLTPQQANDVSLSRDVQPDGKVDHSVQIQMRFCLGEVSCEQDDCFPPSINVKVNSKPCSLPNPLTTNKPSVEPKRPSRPVNITTLCRISPTAPNQVSVSWTSEYNRPYAMGIFLVRRLTASTLLQRIKTKGVRNSEYTRAMIKEKLSQDADSEIKTMILRGSLLCPLGKMRIQIPCRATTCTHIQCFDALLYLQMNEKKPTWVCPVCDKSALYQNLVIDGLFTDIINQAPVDCTEVQFHEDGSWTSLASKKGSCETLNVNNNNIAAKPKDEALSPSPRKKVKPDVEVIVLDSEDEDEENDNGSQDQVRTFGHSSTPVISSGSSNSSDIPNIPTSPDSSLGSTDSPNLRIPDSQSLQTMSENNYSTPLCYSTSNNRSAINPSNRTDNSSSQIPNGSGGRECLNNLPSYSLRSNSTVSSTSPYTAMPLISNHNPPQSSHQPPSYFPHSNTSPFSDPYISSSPHRAPFSGYEAYFNQCLSQSMYNEDMSRDMSYRSNSNSSGIRRSTESGPELISLD